MSSSTRATRSRFSSPAQAQPKNKSLLPLEPSATKGNEASKSFMERWLEPSVQAKTSFEEAGLAKFGVLENMAPLGSLPKARMFTGEAGSAIRKIILKTGAARAKEELDRASSKRSSRSPAGSPPPAKRPARDTSSQEPAAGDSEADVPRETTERTRRKLNRRAAATQDDAAGDESFTSSVKLEVGTPDLAQASATDDKTVVGVVGDDVGQHNVEGWQLSSVDGELPESLAQAADAETMNAFNQQMQQIKQEGSRDNKGCYYFVPPSEDDSSRSLPKSKSSSLGKPDNHDDDGSSEADTRAAKKAKTSHGLGATTEAAKTRLFGSTTTKAGDDQGDEGITATAQPGSAPVQNRKRRRDSESSGASLSPVANAADMDALDSPLARLSTPSPAARPTAATSAGASKTSTSDAPDRRQVNARARTTKTRSSDANSLSVNTTNAANTASPSTNSPRTAHGNMPGRLAASELLSLQGSQPEGAVSEEPPSSPVQHDQDETVWNRRREAQKVTNNYQASESAVRRGAKKSRPSTPVRSSRRTRQSTGAPASTRATRSAVKKPGDDADARSSSVVPSLLADESSLAGSRAVTPTKKPKGGLRVKSS